MTTDPALLAELAVTRAKIRRIEIKMSGLRYHSDPWESRRSTESLLEILRAQEATLATRADGEVA